MEEESDQDKIESCLDIAELDVPIDTAFYYLDHGLSICKKIGYDTVYQFYFQKGLLYYYDGKFQNAKEIILDGSQFTKNTKNPKAYSGQVNMLLGVFSEALNQQDSALIFYDKTLDLLKGDDSKQGKEIQASTFVNKGNIFYKNGTYDIAIPLYIKAAKFSKEVEDYNTQIQTLNNLAACFQSMKEYETAIEYFGEVEKVGEEINDLRTLAGSLTGRGEIYSLQKKYNKALKHLKEAEELCHQRNFPRLLAIIYQNLSDVYLKQGFLHKANQYSLKSIKGLREVRDDFTLVSAFLTRSDLLEKRNKINESLSDDRFSLPFSFKQ